MFNQCFSCPTEISREEVLCEECDNCSCLTDEEKYKVECIACGYKDCPFSEPLHYQQSGCPCCSRR